MSEFEQAEVERLKNITSYESQKCVINPKNSISQIKILRYLENFRSLTSFENVECSACLNSSKCSKCSKIFKSLTLEIAFTLPPANQLKEKINAFYAPNHFRHNVYFSKNYIFTHILRHQHFSCTYSTSSRSCSNPLLLHMKYSFDFISFTFYFFTQYVNNAKNFSMLFILSNKFHILELQSECKLFTLAKQNLRIYSNIKPTVEFQRSGLIWFCPKLGEMRINEYQMIHVKQAY